ncbi:MAG: tetratricopeptide repeat protein [Caldithrix sp.]|nr:MAG: tetratricopeptide repeat protein [Caldithrix sp.]
MIGKTISHYQIIEKIGEGGMGIVYKAKDTTLERTVAIKFLPRQTATQAEERQRFYIEAKAAAALNHPNIATTHAIEEVEDDVFIVMEYIEGQELKQKIDAGPLPVEDAIHIILQIANGLQEAHKKGIVHRDIKSANIMLTGSGQIKIMDFGLAKVRGGAQVTQIGTTLGTAAYMSPEQARGEDVDHRTDIWSLGVVLYETIAGQLPFKGHYEQAVLYSILNEDPESITCLRRGVPTELEAIMNKALAKSPNERYQQVDGMLIDLNVLGKELETKSRQVPKEKCPPSVAVLPFVNVSPEKENEYFSDGMTEEIIDALTKVEGLRVVSRTSVFAFKGKDQDIRKIGEQLNVSHVVEGSVRKAGNRVRITAQLINIADGYHLWSERFDREMEDVFTIQEEIAHMIVNALKIKLVHKAETPLVERSTENIKAYNLFLKGRYCWNKRTEAALKQCVNYFEQAIEIDPDYMLAYCGLADAYALLGIAEYGALPPMEVMPKAKAAAVKALEIDNTLAEAQTTVAHVKAFFDWDFTGADKEFNRAIELNPNYPFSHHWYALYLSAMERHDEAIAEEKRAQELEPLSLIINKNVGTIFYYARKYEQAIEQYKKALELDPDFARTHFFLGLAYISNSMFEEAIAEIKKAITFSGENTVMLALLASAIAMSGKKDEATKILKDLKKRLKRGYVPSFNLAILYMGLDEKASAFEWLEKAYQERSSWLVSLKVEPILDGLRSDPRFTALLKKVGLEK